MAIPIQKNCPDFSKLESIESSGEESIIKNGNGHVQEEPTSISEESFSKLKRKNLALRNQNEKLVSDLEVLVSKATCLTEQVATLSEQKINDEEKIQFLEDELQTVREDMAEKMESLENLKSQLESQTKESVSQSTNIKKMKKTLIGQQTQIENLTKKMDRLTEQRDTALENAEDLQRSVKSFHDRVQAERKEKLAKETTLQRELDKTSAKVASYERQKDKYRHESELLSEENKLLQQKSDNDRAELELLRREMDKKTGKLSQVTEKLGEAETARSQINTFRSKMETLEEAMSRKEAELRDKRSRITELEARLLAETSLPGTTKLSSSELASKEAEIRALMGQVASDLQSGGEAPMSCDRLERLQTDFRVLCGKFRTNEQEMADKQAKIEKLERELKTALKGVEVADGMLVSCQTENSKLRSEFDSNQGQIEKLTEKLQAKAKSNEKLNKELTKSKSELLQAQSVTEQHKVDNEQQIARICQLEREIGLASDDSRTISQRLKTKESELKDLLHKFEKHQNSCAGKIEKLEDTCEILQSENQANKREVQSKSDAISELEHHLKKTKAAFDEVQLERDMLSQSAKHANDEAIQALADAKAKYESAISAKEQRFVDLQRDCNEMKILIDSQKHDFGQQLRRKEDEINELMSELARKNRGIDSHALELKECREKVEKLKIALDEANEHDSELRSKIAQSQLREAEQNASIAKVTKKLEKKNSALGDIEARVKEMSQKCDDLAKNLGEKNAKIEALNHELDLKLSLVTDLERKLDVVSLDKSDLENVVTQNSEQLEKAASEQKEMAELKAKLQQLGKFVTLDGSGTPTFNTGKEFVDVEANTDQLPDLETKIKSLQRNLADQEVVIKHRDAAIKSRTEQLESLQTDLVRDRETNLKRVRELSSELADAQADNMEKTKLLFAVEEKAKSAINELSPKSELRVKSLEKKMDEYLSTISDLQAKLRTCQAENKTLAEAVRAARQRSEKDNLARLKNESSKISSLETELSSAKASIDSLTNQLASALAVGQDDAMAIRKERDDLAVAFGRAKAEIASLKMALDSMRHEFDLQMASDTSILLPPQPAITPRRSPPSSNLMFKQRHSSPPETLDDVIGASSPPVKHSSSSNGNMILGNLSRSPLDTPNRSPQDHKVPSPSTYNHHSTSSNGVEFFYRSTTSTLAASNGFYDGNGMVSTSAVPRSYSRSPTRELQQTNGTGSRERDSRTPSPSRHHRLAAPTHFDTSPPRPSSNNILDSILRYDTDYSSKFDEITAMDSRRRTTLNGNATNGEFVENLSATQPFPSTSSLHSVDLPSTSIYRPYSQHSAPSFYRPASSYGAYTGPSIMTTTAGSKPRSPDFL